MKAIDWVSRCLLSTGTGNSPFGLIYWAIADPAAVNSRFRSLRQHRPPPEQNTISLLDPRVEGYRTDINVVF